MNLLIASGFKGAATKLQAGQVTAGAKRIGCEEAVVRAFLSVESSGSGFDAAGRPKILFEPHVMFRNLLSNEVALAAAVKAGVAYPRQGMRPYLVGSDANYARLVLAMGIDTDAALKAVSWGMGQVLGENYKLCGFTSVTEMVVAAMTGEGAHLDMMLSYIEHDGLVPAMRQKSWTTLAQGYNGNGAVLAYAAKLQAAYVKFASGQAFTAPAPAPAPAAKPIAFAAPKMAVLQPKGVSPDLFPAEVGSDALNDAEWLRIRSGNP